MSKSGRGSTSRTHVSRNPRKPSARPGPQRGRRSATTAPAAQLGAQDERRRIAQDLHDDVIPPLLSFIYRTDSPALADAARLILKRLRDILRQLDREGPV